MDAGRRRARAAGVAIGVALACAVAGCVSTPAPGETFVAQIVRIPTTRAGLEFDPALSLAVRRGVTREQVQAGRLRRVDCHADSAGGGYLRHGFVLMPAASPLAEDQVVELAAEPVPDFQQPYARFFGTDPVALPAPPPDAYYSDRYRDPLVRCTGPDAGGRMRVQVGSKAATWDYDFARAEVARGAWLSDADIRAGRIAVGECATGVESWAEWNLRVPPGMRLAPGDTVEAIAGDHEKSLGVGPPARILRRVGPPRAEDRMRTAGHLRVRCAAPPR